MVPTAVVPANSNVPGVCGPPTIRVESLYPLPMPLALPRTAGVTECVISVPFSTTVLPP